MIRKTMKMIFKELNDRILRTNSHSPDQLIRTLTSSKIDALSDGIDQLAIELENRLLVIESKLEDMGKRKKHAKKN